MTIKENQYNIQDSENDIFLDSNQKNSGLINESKDNVYVDQKYPQNNANKQLQLQLQSQQLQQQQQQQQQQLQSQQQLQQLQFSQQQPLQQQQQLQLPQQQIQSLQQNQFNQQQKYSFSLPQQQQPQQNGMMQIQFPNKVHEDKFIPQPLLSEDASLYGQGSTFPAKSGFLIEQKKERVKNKNERNKLNLAGPTKRIAEQSANELENSPGKQYINSHYNYGQRSGNQEHFNMVNNNNKNIDNSLHYENEFVSQTPEYNEDYHNLLKEDNMLYETPDNNFNNQHIQIPSSLASSSQNNEIFAYQNTPMKGYMNNQIEYSNNNNNFGDNYGVQQNYIQNTFNNNDQGLNSINPSANNQGMVPFSQQNAFSYQQQPTQNAHFFSKRQSLTLEQQETKKRRSKFNQLKDLATMHRENDEHLADDQLEII